MKNTNKAFTLVELIVVITILAILGTIAFISLQGYSQDAKNAKVSSDLRTMVTAIETKITDGTVSMASTVDDTISLSGASLNWVLGDFASGATIGTDGTYKVGKIHFANLKQPSSDFQYNADKDTALEDYIAAIVVDTVADVSFYQLAGQTINADDTYTAIVKGNFVQLENANIGGLIDAHNASGTGVINNESTDSLYN